MSSPASHLSDSDIPSGLPLSDLGPLSPSLSALSSQSRNPSGTGSTSRTHIPHPYARLYAKKEDNKRRKIWNHALEKSLFNAYELSTLGAPHRRTIYMASLEAHVDQLHAQLLDVGYWPVRFEDLEPFKGLNSKTAKSMVSGLQFDTADANVKLLELKRANDNLTQEIEKLQAEKKRRHDKVSKDGYY